MSEKLPRVEGHELVRALERAGFERVRQKGSHMHPPASGGQKTGYSPCSSRKDTSAGHS
jgi:predicted RNA binding protein YcfA (HicA-like mRNA interferase family)